MPNCIMRSLKGKVQSEYSGIGRVFERRYFSFRGAAFYCVLARSMEKTTWRKQVKNAFYSEKVCYNGRKRF